MGQRASSWYHLIGFLFSWDYTLWLGWSMHCVTDGIYSISLVDIISRIILWGFINDGFLFLISGTEYVRMYKERLYFVLNNNSI